MMAKNGYLYNKVVNCITPGIGVLVLVCDHIGDMVKKINFIREAPYSLNVTVCIITLKFF